MPDDELKKSWKRGFASQSVDIDLRDACGLTDEEYKRAVEMAREKAQREGKRVILADGTIEDYMFD